MAGWRIGMAVGNSAALSALLQVKSNIDSGIFRAIQDAAVVALNSGTDWMVKRNAIYQRRRDLILDTLGHLGIRADWPQAGMYVWAETPRGTTSAALADRLLNEVGVSVTPGTAFGAFGEGYLRISMGRDTARIKEALARLSEFEF
jgi:LL-diaminopimelate aminotransferase